MSILEKDVQKAIVDLLVLQSFLVLRVNQGSRAIAATKKHKRRFIRFAYWLARGVEETHAGIADIIAVGPEGKFWAIEVKAPGKRERLTDAQEKFLNAVTEAGGIALVADSPAFVQTAINKYYGLNHDFI